MNFILAPSLLSADFGNLASECIAIENADIPWLHLDVMDGHFAPNITFGAPVVGSIRSNNDLFFDAHLMVEHPERFFDDLAKAGCDLLVPHIEAMTHSQRCLSRIHELGLKAGIALNPDTDFNTIRWLLPDIDLLMLMSVNPGFSGQYFIPQIFDKIRHCREFLVDHDYGDLPIEVDGGVNLENVPMLIKAGANILVSGSSFFQLRSHALAREYFDNAASESALDEYSARALAEAETWQHRQ